MDNRRGMPVLLVGFLGVGLTLAACSDGPGPQERTRRKQETIFGSTAHDWNDGPASPWGGVAQIFVDYTECPTLCPDGNPPTRGACFKGGTPAPRCTARRGSCSGTLIERDLVVTAGHCFCSANHPPVSTIQRTTVEFPAADSPAFDGPHFFYTVDTCEGDAEDDASKDLAVITLEQNVDESIVNAPLIKPYLGSDPIGFFANDYTAPFFAGYGHSAADGDEGLPLTVANFTDPVQLDDDNWDAFGDG